MSEYEREKYYDTFTTAFEEFWPSNVQVKVFSQRDIANFSKYLSVSKKMLTLYEASQRLGGDWIIYIEPNMIAQKEITQQFLSEMCDPTYYHCYYGDPRNELRFDTTWLAFNTNHQVYLEFINTLKNIFESEPFPGLLAYSDGYLLGTVRHLINAIECNEQCKNVITITHPRDLFSNSIMGEYFKKI